MTLDPGEARDRTAILALCVCLSRDGRKDEALGAIGRVGWQAVLDLADELRVTPALVTALRAKDAAPDMPALILRDGRRTISARLDEAQTAHLLRRTAQQERLVELVSALNEAGISPVLLKGARSLWMGAPEWRTMRDLDLLITGPDGDAAQAVALSLGYRRAEGGAERAGKHHFAPLFRDDLPGWLEMHRRAATHRAEGFVPTALLETMCEVVPRAGATARMLRRPAHLVHALIHHHVGHRGDKRGWVDLKGLYEFAADVTALSPAEREMVIVLALRHPRVLAALELWIAAAHQLFGLPVAEPFVVYLDARLRAKRAIERLSTPESRYAGALEEIGFAASRERLLRMPGGNSLMVRQIWRARTVASMLRPMIRLWGE